MCETLKLSPIHGSYPHLFVSYPQAEGQDLLQVKKGRSQGPSLLCLFDQASLDHFPLPYNRSRMVAISLRSWGSSSIKAAILS